VTRIGKHEDENSDSGGLLFEDQPADLGLRVGKSRHGFDRDANGATRQDRIEGATLLWIATHGDLGLPVPRVADHGVEPGEEPQLGGVAKRRSPRKASGRDVQAHRGRDARQLNEANVRELAALDTADLLS
jgi:hypothetical protein